MKKLFRLTNCRDGEEHFEDFNQLLLMVSELCKLLVWRENDVFIIQSVRKEEDDE